MSVNGPLGLQNHPGPRCMCRDCVRDASPTLETGALTPAGEQYVADVKRVAAEVQRAAEQRVGSVTPPVATPASRAPEGDSELQRELTRAAYDPEVCVVYTDEKRQVNLFRAREILRRAESAACPPVGPPYSEAQNGDSGEIEEASKVLIRDLPVYDLERLSGKVLAAEIERLRTFASDLETLVCRYRVEVEAEIGQLREERDEAQAQLQPLLDRLTDGRLVKARLEVQVERWEDAAYEAVQGVVVTPDVRPPLPSHLGELRRLCEARGFRIGELEERCATYSEGADEADKQFARLEKHLKEWRDAAFSACAGLVGTPENPTKDPMRPSHLADLRALCERQEELRKRARSKAPLWSVDEYRCTLNGQEWMPVAEHEATADGPFRRSRAVLMEEIDQLEQQRDRCRADLNKISARAAVRGDRIKELEGDLEVERDAHKQTGARVHELGGVLDQKDRAEEFKAEVERCKKHADMLETEIGTARLQLVPLLEGFGVEPLGGLNSELTQIDSGIFKLRERAEAWEQSSRYWFDQLNRPCPGGPKVHDLRELVELLLPMAKGYAHANPGVDVNSRILKRAEKALQ